MAYEAWMLAAMEEYGHMDTQTGRINKIARYLAQLETDHIGNEEFIDACHACNIDPYSFDQEDLMQIEKKFYEFI